ANPISKLWRDNARIGLERLRYRLLAVGLLGRLLAALLVDPGVHRGHQTSRLLLGADLPNERRARLHRLGNCPVGLFRGRLEQPRDQVALLLGGEVPAVDVLRDDIGNRIINAQMVSVPDGPAVRVCSSIWSGCQPSARTAR